MDYATWAPTMAAIREEFGFSEAADRAAAEQMRDVVPAFAPARELGFELRNRANVSIVGCGPSLLRVEAAQFSGQVVVACDGASERLREIGIVPHVVVTDLDGDPASLLWAAGQGSRMVVHAHGDNVGRLSMAASFPQVHGTHQVEPTPDLQPLMNPGGFTDGDRALVLCEHLGARRVRLVGFDLQSEPSKYSHDWDRKTKPRKLAWAERIIGEVHARGKTYVEHWVPRPA